MVSNTGSFINEHYFNYFLDNPYWDLISESSILLPIGTNESIGIRFAYNSRGYGNSGQDIAIDLTLEPQSTSLLDGLTTDPNQYYYYYTFTASISDRGSFVFQGELHAMLHYVVLSGNFGDAWHVHHI